MNKLLTFGLVVLASTAFSKPADPGEQWEDKTVLFLGDSMSDPDTAEYFKAKYYWSYLADWLDLDAKVYAKNGQQWHEIYDQAKKARAELKEEPAAVVILAGTNDYALNARLGHWYDLVVEKVNSWGKMVDRQRRMPNRDTQYFRGRLNHTLEYLKVAYPNSQIVVLTPIHRAYFTCGGDNIQVAEDYGNDLGLRLEDYIADIKLACARWSVPVIDLNAECSLQPMLKNQGALFVNSDTDRLHPNSAGHERIALTVYYRLQTMPAGFPKVIKPGCECGAANDRGVTKVDEKCPLLGSWAMYLPYERMNAGHMIVEREKDGTLAARMLLRGSSPEKCSRVEYENGKFRISRNGGYTVDGVVKGDVAECTLTQCEADGKLYFGPAAFICKRNPPIDMKASTKDAKFGEPIDLLANGLDGFEKMSENGEFGWSFKNGVLSNRVSQKDGNFHGRGINIRTKRQDFFDFKLDYDVNVPKGANSGMYLRGRYELQVNDSYGKPVDSHNMAALYGRITPSTAAEKPAGEWQHVTVVLYKRHITVELNGVKIIDDKPVEGITGGAIDANEFVPGPIYIQGDHTNADYKNIILRPAL